MFVILFVKFNVLTFVSNDGVNTPVIFCQFPFLFNLDCKVAILNIFTKAEKVGNSFETEDL